SGAAGNDDATTTPIKHVVVIFDENISFDHYFGTYPNATNPAGESPFTAAAGTPSVNGLTGTLLTNNPNDANPRRLDPQVPTDVITCDFNHNYTPEQSAFDGGLMDLFAENTHATGGTSNGHNCLADQNDPAPANPNATMTMNYYDGNTVTGLWNYAQH